jgi:23S rRNA (cytidine2498-2'-O)-methyltransferase
MHALLAAPECGAFLAQELGMAETSPGEWLQTGALPAPPLLAFARQVLPNSQTVHPPSINAWAQAIASSIIGVVPDDGPWRLHLWPRYGEGKAGAHRCALIRESLNERLKKVRRRLVRGLRETVEPFAPETSLVQVVLTAPDAGYVSVSPAPQPYDLRAVVSAFTGGEVPVAEDKAAPARAFAKLVEAELRLGRGIQGGETCVDLGASPGSWSYVALNRGARVTAVDRSPLRDDLMRHPHLRFHQGDAFKFRPDAPVDWLVCDVIAAPQRSIDLLLEWLRAGLMRQFVVTIKFKGAEEYPLLTQLKQHAPPLCTDFRLTRLCANKNEVCAFAAA